MLINIIKANIIAMSNDLTLSQKTHESMSKDVENLIRHINCNVCGPKQIKDDQNINSFIQSNKDIKQMLKDILIHMFINIFAYKNIYFTFSAYGTEYIGKSVKISEQNIVLNTIIDFITTLYFDYNVSLIDIMFFIQRQTIHSQTINSNIGYVTPNKQKITLNLKFKNISNRLYVECASITKSNEQLYKLTNDLLQSNCIFYTNDIMGSNIDSTKNKLVVYQYVNLNGASKPLRESIISQYNDDIRENRIHEIVVDKENPLLTIPKNLQSVSPIIENIDDEYRFDDTENNIDLNEKTDWHALIDDTYIFSNEHSNCDKDNSQDLDSYFALPANDCSYKQSTIKDSSYITDKKDAVQRSPYINNDSISKFTNFEINQHVSIRKDDIILDDLDQTKEKIDTSIKKDIIKPDNLDKDDDKKSTADTSYFVNKKDNSQSTTAHIKLLNIDKNKGDDIILEDSDQTKEKIDTSIKKDIIKPDNLDKDDDKKSTADTSYVVNKKDNSKSTKAHIKALNVDNSNVDNYEYKTSTIIIFSAFSVLLLLAAIAPMVYKKYSAKYYTNNKVNELDSYIIENDTVINELLDDQEKNTLIEAF